MVSNLCVIPFPMSHDSLYLRLPKLAVPSLLGFYALFQQLYSCMLRRRTVTSRMTSQFLTQLPRGSASSERHISFHTWSKIISASKRWSGTNSFMLCPKMATVLSAKAALRTSIKQRIKIISPEEKLHQSSTVTSKVLSHPNYISSEGISVFLSLPDEIDTSEIIQDIFRQGKRCYIPSYATCSTFMTMVRIHSLEDLQTLPKTSWNIPQPSIYDTKDDCLQQGGLDLILIPGLAFTREGHRLGRGKGYYDTFLRNYNQKYLTPKTMALAFKEAVVANGEIPISDHDFTINELLFEDS